MNATLVGWLMTLLFVLFLAAGFLIGCWRGLRKSTISSVLSLVGIVIAFFITPVITNALLGINVNVDGEAMPIREIALYLFKQDPDISLLMIANPNLQTLALSLPGAIINAVLFIAVTIVVELVLYHVYKILAKVAFKERLGAKKRRAWGGAVGLVKTFIIVIVAVMPLASLIGLASSMLGTPASQQQQVVSAAESDDETYGETILSSSVPNEIIEIVGGLENNMLIQCCSVFGMDDAMFDYFATVDINDEKVVIRKEVSNVYQTVNSVYQVKRILTEGSGKVSSLDYDALSRMVNEIVDGPMFKTIISETAGEMFVSYEDYDLQNAIDVEILEDIKAGLETTKQKTGSYHAYFADDIKIVFEIFRKLGEGGYIDGIVAVENQTPDGILSYITCAGNVKTFTSCILSAFEMNILRACAEPLAQQLVNSVAEGKIVNVDTSHWTDAQWTEAAQSLSDTVTLLGEVLDDIELSTLSSNVMMLLDKNENYDIVSILGKTGQIIDNLRGNALLQVTDAQTNEESPLIDMFLGQTLSLPTENVKTIDANGTIVEKEISSYVELFEFVSPALVKMRDENIYNILSNSTNMIKDLADVISKAGKKDLLRDIILPLNQVSPTKEIMSSYLANMGGDLMDLTTLNTYEEWKSDLEYISTLLINLNKAPISSSAKKYLDYVLEGDLAGLVDVLNTEDVTGIFTPIIYAKSTETVRNNVFSMMGEMLTDMVDMQGVTVTLDYENAVFEKGNIEDQTAEFCAVVESLVLVKKSYADGDLKSINKNHLGAALEVMKYNAYRTSLTEIPMISLNIVSGKLMVTYVDRASNLENDGVFKDAFAALMTKMKTTYGLEIAALELFEVAYPAASEEDKAKAAFYKDALDNNRYDTINFIDMMDFFERYAAAE